MKRSADSTHCCRTSTLIVSGWDLTPTSGVASPKLFLRGKSDFRRATVFCVGCCFSRHKMTRYAKTLGGHGPLETSTTPATPTQFSMNEYNDLTVINRWPSKLLQLLQSFFLRSRQYVSRSTHKTCVVIIGVFPRFLGNL